MTPKDPSEGAVMPRHRLWLVLEDIECQDPSELESLLEALAAAAWPTASALDQ